MFIIRVQNTAYKYFVQWETFYLHSRSTFGTNTNFESKKKGKGAFYLWIGQTCETVGQTFARNSAGTLVGPTSTKVGLVQVALENFDKEDITRYTELFLIFEIVFAYPTKYGFSMG